MPWGWEAGRVLNGVHWGQRPWDSGLASDLGESGGRLDLQEATWSLRVGGLLTWAGRVQDHPYPPVALRAETGFETGSKALFLL